MSETYTEKDIHEATEIGKDLKVKELLKALDSFAIRQHLGVKNIDGLKRLIKEGK